jgi:hypothetical protein
LIEFIDENGGGPGVWLGKRHQKRARQSGLRLAALFNVLHHATLIGATPSGVLV